MTNAERLLSTTTTRTNSSVERVLADNANGSLTSLDSKRAVMRSVDEQVRIHLVARAIGVEVDLLVKSKRTENNLALTDRASRLPTTATVENVVTE